MLTRSGAYVKPLLVGFIDDRSRFLCHAQWYTNEGSRELVHGLCQALQKVGLPRSLMTDNGSAMISGEFTAGLHMLFLDGVYVIDEAGRAVFRHAPESGAQDLQTLVEHIARGIGRTLERRGLIERDIENAWLTGDGEGGPLDDLLGHSVTYRIAVGPQGRAEAVHAADGAGEAAAVA